MRWLLGIAAMGAALLASSASPGVGADGAAARDAAMAALARGDSIAAQAELEKALKAGSSRTDVAAAMGDALIAQENYARAREWLAPGLFARGQQSYGWRMLGKLERLSGNLDAAGKAYDRALAAAPEDPLVWVDIGRLRYIAGDQLQAVEAADRALAVDPANPRALEFRAQLLRDAAGGQAALALYERALKQAPDDLGLMAGYAATLGELGRASEMLAVTRRMIDRAPKDPQAWYLQAVLAARAGRTDLARGLLARTGKALDDVPAALLLGGALELEAGNANLAVSRLDRLVQIQPANPRAQLLLARALYDADDLHGVIQRFAPLAARADASPYLLTIVARTYEDLGDRVAAATLLDRAASLRTPAVMPIANTDGPAGPVRAALNAGNRAGAEAVALRLVQVHPGSAWALSLAGDAALAQNAGVRALGFYDRAARIRYPERMLLRMIEASESLGQAQAGVALVRRYYDANPQSRLATRLMAGHAAFGGDWAHARSLLEHLRTRGGNRDARLLADLSLAQLKTGDPEAALESAQRAAQLQPASGVAAQAWGMALAELDGDPALAAQLLDKARRIDGDNPLLSAARQALGAAP